LVLLASFALAGYSVSVLGLGALWNHRIWWQSIAVWFAAAIIAHDLVLYPAYALVDRVLVAVGGRTRLRVPPLNYIRVPLLGIGLSFLMFFPGIVEQGAVTYRAAAGGTQQPFLVRWLLLSAGLLIVSAVGYTARVIGVRRHDTRQGLAGDDTTAPTSDEAR
jgi:hypothetical protein